MFLDWSGSMVEHIGNTIKQLVNLTSFCKKVNIPFEVYSFVERIMPEKEFSQSPKTGDLQIHRFGLANILSSRMNSVEMTYAYSALFAMAGVNGRRARTPLWLCMSGTPLNEAIIAAMEIVPEFQKKYNLQFVNTVFLTDGEGSNIGYAYSSEFNCEPLFRAYNKSISHIVLRDPVNKREVKYENVYSSFSQTKALIRLLKLRTNSNVIGFYVTTNRELSRKITTFYPETQKDFNKQTEIRDSFRKNKYLIVENSGFDEYYVLRSQGLDTEENTELQAPGSGTTRSFVSAFSKYTGNKINNRVILNRFINLIT